MFDNFTLLFLVESRLKTVALETILNESTFLFYIIGTFLLTN